MKNYGNITEVWGPTIRIPPLTFYLGREFRFFRVLYWKLTKKYWWGIAQFDIDSNRRLKWK